MTAVTAGPVHPAAGPIHRLVSFGTVLVDLVCVVPGLPEPGGDVFGSSGALVAGGGFTAMAAARRGGLRTLHAGTTGTGPFGDLARAALATSGIETVLAPVVGLDTGVCVVLVDASGERTFVTMPGAEGRFEPAWRAQVPVRPTDAVLVSGYGLVHPVTRRTVLAVLAGLPDRATLVVDPGPLGHELDPAAREALFARADWFTCNDREATLLTGHTDPALAASALAEQLARAAPGLDAPSRQGAHAVVRIGAAGCILAGTGAMPVLVGAAPASVVSTNGAGDAHTGALVSALAAGRPPLAALRQANADTRDFLNRRESNS
ncbi:PfkB family carbohydrate kinase [Cryobacterium sp. SO1]|uniref:PfkB family carbohydrate kinase n=1 Tax=Cryobacterium sp. SO1 TaxID=1897061 RepID=UPI001023F17D|nr:PfkB family carbohydrate kinase [Cryobacterium sp. SO1]RZI37021.1 Ribokinase [Cryobacterium sp. SO1]